MSNFKILSTIVIALLSTSACMAQSGMCYKLSTHSHTNQMDLPGNTTIYVSSAGHARIETKAELPFMGKVNMVTLISKKNPTHTILVNEKRKLYAIQTKETEVMDTTGLAAMPITKMGNETVNGFPCVHLKLGDLKDTVNTMEVWISKAVPGYKTVNEIAKGLLGLPDAILQVLKKKGYNGFQVKFVEENKSSNPNAVSMTVELTKASPTAVPDSMLKVPAGYTETKGDPFSMNFHSETKINENFKSEGKIGNEKK